MRPLQAGDRVEYVAGPTDHEPGRVGWTGTVRVAGWPHRHSPASVSWDNGTATGAVNVSNLRPLPEVDASLAVSPDGATPYLLPEPTPEPEPLDPARVAALDKAAEVLRLLDVRPTTAQVTSLASWLLGGRS